MLPSSAVAGRLGSCSDGGENLHNLEGYPEAFKMGERRGSIQSVGLLGQCSQWLWENETILQGYETDCCFFGNPPEDVYRIAELWKVTLYQGALAKIANVFC